ncbi:MAG: simple sugar transport system substrate-binding protein [Chloroflexi bacterium]|nr:MAG: simple sugar transport system substrate-binding protein [Chloroflexota bacterium]MBA4374573.1 BMP family ABC transporter substrate-binding protein [Anaerolinea sp.]
MFSKRTWTLVSLLLIVVLALSACAKPTAAPTAAPATEAPVVVTTEAPKEITFGLLLVGPYNDHGWSEAHFNAGLYVEEKLPGTKMIYLDKVNPADRPGTTPAQLADELVGQGATVILFNSDDMKDSATEFAAANPTINVIMASGDQQWAEGKDFKNLPNMVNVMGEMEYGKMMAGCAAALTTKTGQIGYLGPLINDETRRLVSSAYLGAKYCWTTYLGKPAEELKFKVTWIGFWFNIPGFTSDPTQVADDFFNSNYDVVISGIDTTEAIVQANKMKLAGKEVWAIPYDYEGACDEAPDICLGVPYFNWGPSYLGYVTAAMNGEYKPLFEWVGPDWTNINNPDTSMIGFKEGDALSAEAKANVDKFIAELAGGLQLFAGPMNLQDGTVYLKDGEKATDLQIWYLPQLLEGMEGKSLP